MKKIILLFIIVFFGIILWVCFNSSNTNEDVAQNESDSAKTSGEEYNVLNVSFEERIKDAQKYLDIKDEYGINAFEGFNDDGFYYISKASLEKASDFYVMKLHYSSPKLYSKADVENAYDLAQKNGKYSLEDFTFYKNNNIPITSMNKENLNSEIGKRAFNQYKKASKIATYSDGEVIFEPTPNNESFYYITYVYWPAEYLNFVVTEETKTKSVVLLAEDKMLIVPTDLGDYNTELEGIDISVEEFYNKAINHEVATDELIEGYEYDLNDVGDNEGHYRVQANAVEFDGEYIKVNYKKGGI